MNEDVKIIRKARHKYVVKTPNGEFDDINEVIDEFPQLKEDKRVKLCSVCGKWFYDLSKRNIKKYCNNHCSKQSNREKRMDDGFYKKYFVKPDNDKAADFKQKTKDYDIKYKDDTDLSYNQDDNYYGLGTSNLTVNARTDDWKKEAKYIKEELKRLKLN